MISVNLSGFIREQPKLLITDLLKAVVAYRVQMQDLLYSLATWGCVSNWTNNYGKALNKENQPSTSQASN